ncbi:MAG: disulfide bond formation protein B [Paracoccaceae bacterium]
MSARWLPLCALLGPAAVLGGALFSQYVGGLMPCPMCIWQRWPHGVAIALAALALLVGPGRVGAALLWFGAAALLIGAGLGAFHAGVELQYWEGPSSCTGGAIGGLTPQQLIEQIMAAPLVRCDEIEWSFLGVSMAGWNAVLSLFMAGLTGLAARRYASSSASQ